MSLCLPHHCDEGEQNGDDGFLVHVYFLLLVVWENLFEFRFQFVHVIRHGNDGAVTVDEEQGTVLSAVLMEYAELVINVNKAGPRKGMTLDGLTHGICGLEFVGKAEHIQATITILFI